MKSKKTKIMGVVLFLIFLLILPLYNNLPNVCMPCPPERDYCPPCGSTAQLEFFGLSKITFGWISGEANFNFPNEPLYILWDSIGVIVTAFLLTWLILLIVKKFTSRKESLMP